MTISAQSILRRVIDTLQDTTSIRWPIDELIRYLNDAQREVVMYRPDAMVTNGVVTCVAGTKQRIPANGKNLIEVIRNTSTGRAVRMTNREILDAQLPGWHAHPPKSEAVHFMFDPRDPTVFYVYPAVITGTQLDTVYAAYPTDIASVGESGTLAQVTGNLSVRDIDSNSIQNYLLARCYFKDSEYAGNAARATAHYQMFAVAMGIDFKGTIDFAPTSAGNPNVTGRVSTAPAS